MAMMLPDEARGRAGERARATARAKLTGTAGGQGGGEMFRPGKLLTTSEVRQVCSSVVKYFLFVKKHPER